MSDITNSPVKVSWAKQVYFYFIMVGCMVSFAISGVTLAQKLLSKYIFTKANYSWSDMYGYMGNNPEQNCIGELNSNFYVMKGPNPTNEQPPAIAPEKLKECVDKKVIQEADRKESEYQNTVLNSILALIVTGLIFGLHLKYVKLK
jgi:hypothetical protein